MAEIPVKIRGGSPLTLGVRANVIIPEVRIEQPEFDFGEVLYGDSKSLTLTLHNDSNIDAVLILDLRA